MFLVRQISRFSISLLLRSFGTKLRPLMSSVRIRIYQLLMQLPPKCYERESVYQKKASLRLRKLYLSALILREGGLHFTRKSHYKHYVCYFPAGFTR